MVLRDQDLDFNIVRWGLHHLLDSAGAGGGGSPHCAGRPQPPTTDYYPPPPQTAEARIDAVENDEVIAHALQEELAQVAMAETDGGASSCSAHAVLAQHWIRPEFVSHLPSAPPYVEEEAAEGSREQFSSCSSPEDDNGQGCSIELVEDFSAIDGEVGKRLNDMVPVPEAHSLKAQPETHPTSTEEGPSEPELEDPEPPANGSQTGVEDPEPGLQDPELPEDGSQTGVEDPKLTPTRGCPPGSNNNTQASEQELEPVEKKRRGGRPRKQQPQELELVPKKPRGRPPKQKVALDQAGIPLEAASGQQLEQASKAIVVSPDGAKGKPSQSENKCISQCSPLEFASKVLKKLNEKQADDKKSALSLIEKINWHCVLDIQPVKLNKQLELFLIECFDTKIDRFVIDGQPILESHPEIYAGYVPMDYREYLKKMPKNGEWGDHVTLQAAADSYGVKIFILTSFRDTCYIEILPVVQKSNRVICLSFWAEVHYNSIYPEGELPVVENRKRRWWHLM